MQRRKVGATIAAISTAQGAAGVGMIRISGDSAREIADRVFTSPHGKKIKQAQGYTALYGKVHKPFKEGEICEVLDQAIALVFACPASFTGEDVVELSCHGGLTVMKNVLRAVFAAGAVPAQPGEFTKRAFLNGKLGLTEAEAVMQLISAQGEQAMKMALAVHQGALEKKINAIRTMLITAAAHLSAWADYPEDDIPQLNPEVLKNNLYEANCQIEELLSQFDAGKAIREGVNTVIAGKPNVGKSTLMNLLSGCERSIVTQFAGTTRDVVEETVLLGDIPLCLADTAGIYITNDPVESIGVDKAKNRIKTAELVFAVFDSSRELSDEDKNLIENIQQIPAVAVVNKSDLPAVADLDYIKKKFYHVVSISALSGDGLKQLEQAVADVLQTAQLNPADGILTTERQRDAAQQAKQALKEAIYALESGMTLDAVTVSIEGAVSALLELTGERATEAVVDSVFAQFCVGK